jgi:1-deoxy-D-xylulose-5-phosphate reductoisomerase
MDQRIKKIALLGSTGSIGTQTLEVIEKHSEKFEIEVLTANNNADLLIKQAIKYKPNHIVIRNEEKYSYVSEALSGYPVKVYAGEAALSQIVDMPSIDMVVTALVGYSGLNPTINALKAGKHLALANKETLVVAGDLIVSLACKNKINIIPVDSEHSAIFQCLAGEYHNKIEKIYLTASGGPFRGKDINYLSNVTPKEALMHPNWCMGAKVSIDSASLMNKGLEAIEARWLFNVIPEKIEVLVHPQSIIHSLVQFEDGSLKAQMGVPDMRLPIQYALSYPQRIASDFKRINFMDHPTFTFELPDTKVFRNLLLAYEAMNKGGNMPCVMNAANEIAVNAFLCGKIKFLKMPEIIENAMNNMHYIAKPTLEDYHNSDVETRKYANSLV